jgi:hypothetical protein
MTTLAISLCWVNIALSQEPTCCSRAVTASRTPMPEPQERDASGMITGAINEVFLDTGWGPESLEDCPLEIGIYDFDAINRTATWLGGKNIDKKSGDAAIQALFIDYVVQPSLTLKRTIKIVPGEWEEGYGGEPYYYPGNVIGDWSIRVALIDPHHGVTLKKVDATWTGNVSLDGQESFYSLARKLMPLDDLIHEYERLPELCDVQPEKESIEAGQTMTIDITDIVDSRMAAPQPWQRILVRAEKGKILNGYEKAGWHIFEAGSGSVTVQYKSPQTCEDEQEELQVWNSCNCTGTLFNTLAKKEIGRTHFNIYDRKPEKLTVHPEPIKVKVGDSASVRLTNIVDAEGKPLEPNEQVMIEVDKGRITNGMPLGGYKVFDVVQGHVDVNYQAPDDLSVNLDTIKIFNLCVKGDELVEVVPHKLIAQKPIIIEFPPLVARITRTLEESRDTHIDKTEWGDLRKVRKGNSYSTKRVAIIASFSENPEGIHIPHTFQLPHGIKLPQGFQMMPAKLHYRMLDCRVVSQTFSYNGEYYSADYDARGLTSEGTTRTVRNGRAGRINPPCEKNAIALKTDSSTGTAKVNYVSVPFFDVEFLVDEHVEYKGKKEGTDRQLVPNNSSSSRNFTSNFAVQPTVVKDKEACFKVTGGDGVRVMSGRCTETLPQSGDDLQRTTREIYEWQVSRR